MPKRKSASPDGHFSTAIICDDIRQERSGKHILIGVYSGDILLAEMPSAFAPAVYAEYAMLEPSEQEFVVRYFFDDRLSAELKGRFGMRRPGTAPLALPAPLIEVTAEGELRVEVQFDDGTPTTISRKRVRLNPDASVSESPSAQSRPGAPAS